MRLTPPAGEGIIKNHMQNNSFDILICGAGLIGTSLALALAPLPLRIAITEAQLLKTEIDLQADGRSLALNYASVKILEAIGIWPQLNAHVTPIKTVHVSERGRFGKLRFKAEEEGVAALGHVIPAPLLGVTLNQTLLAEKNLTVFNPAKVIALVKNASGYDATLQTANSEQKISARLVIAADGVNSSLRELMGIVTQTQIHHQSALATRITTTLPLNNIAYERFINEGALALLPLAENKAALIFTGADTFIQTLYALDEKTFLQKAQNYFGERLGAFLQVEKRHVYPLKSLYANEQVKESFVLLGNAAHTLHPIAAQGFNLGLQDVALLAEMIAEATKTHKNFTELNYLQLYEQQRLTAQKQVVNFTHQLMTIFAYDLLPLNLARSASLKLLDLFPPAKHRLASRLMGVSGRVSKLILGVPLD